WGLFGIPEGHPRQRPPAAGASGFPARFFRDLLRTRRPGHDLDRWELGVHHVRKRRGRRRDLEGPPGRGPGGGRPVTGAIARLRRGSIPLLVGALLGFIGGYFAAGGGRPNAAAAAPARGVG